ncbi:hypothetical protein BC834DRAFT_902010 [Gloeopeniophorella convolvens]|nr:hypothetical protein BC834DRAFT_902010 [Gloeopeniophorella convolvens]
METKLTRAGPLSNGSSSSRLPSKDPNVKGPLKTAYSMLTLTFEFRLAPVRQHSQQERLFDVGSPHAVDGPHPPSLSLQKPTHMSAGPMHRRATVHKCCRIVWGLGCRLLVGQTGQHAPCVFPRWANLSSFNFLSFPVMWIAPHIPPRYI